MRALLRYLWAGIICLALVVNAPCIANATGRPFDFAVITKLGENFLVRFDDPGVAPAFNLQDYAAFVAPGRASLSGGAWAQIDDGHQVGCDRVYLAPDTPYTEWLVAKWARSLDQHQQLAERLEPDSQSSGQPVPEILDAERANSVVRTSECDQTGTFSFDKLPIGKYLFYGTLRREYVQSDDSHEFPSGIGLPEGLKQLSSSVAVRYGTGYSFSVAIDINREGAFEILHDHYNVNAKFWGAAGY